MNISQIFGTNLRALCARKGTITSISRELGISRVQFNRYVNSESFPKPAALDQICKYFGFDARILTELIPEEVLKTQSLRKTQNRSTLRNYAFENAVNFLHSSINYDVPKDELADGLYLNWRNSMNERGRAVCSVFQISSVSGQRVFRGYVLPKLFSEPMQRKPKLREYRGLIFRQADGYALCLFQQPPFPLMAFMYVARPYDNMDNLLRGYMGVTRNEYLGKQRLSRCVFEKLPDTPQGIIKGAHSSKWMDLDEVPPHIRSELSLPLDAR